MTRALNTCIALACVLAGCSSGNSEEESHGVGGSGSGSSTGGSGSGSAGAGSTAATGAGGIVIGVGGGTSGSGGSGATGNGMQEVCDGIDNDANGIIDDVDAGGDGVCDCLNIGTIGHIGPWSNGGNIFATWLNLRTPRGVVELGDEVLTPERLAPLNVIVSLHVATEEVSSKGVTAPAHHAFSDAEVAAFSSWVRAGGGVMTTIGYAGDEAREVVNVNLLLSPIGMGYSTTENQLSNFVQEWTPHPVTDGVRNIFTDNGVSPDGAAGTTVALGQASRVALQVAEVENGRAVVWGDEWITYDSEWVDVEDQQVELFWLNILKWLSPPRTCQVPIPPDIPR